MTRQCGFCQKEVGYQYIYIENFKVNGYSEPIRLCLNCFKHAAGKTMFKLLFPKTWNREEDKP